MLDRPDRSLRRSPLPVSYDVGVVRSIPALVALVALTAGVSCGSTQERPSRAEWGQEWQALQEQVPGPDAILDADDPASACDEGLAAVREARGGELEPTPDGQLDTTYEAWTSAAETYLFDCPVHDEAMLDDLAEATADAATEVDDHLAP
jgi:hypothetical protein